MTVTAYKVSATVNARIAIASDLHNKEYSKVIGALKKLEPDCILIPGDLTACLNKPESECRYDNSNGFGFLKAAVEICPVFYSVGNHEKSISEENALKIKKTGATLLDNEYVLFKGMYMGGVTCSDYSLPHKKFSKTPPPNIAFLDEFEKLNGYKVLLCHHPEYYDDYISRRKIDLTVSGHAHGGQWRFFGKGVFAPGQGIFPKYTSGMYDGKFIISRGLANNTCFPRLFNRKEIVLIEMRER